MPTTWAGSWRPWYMAKRAAVYWTRMRKNAYRVADWLLETTSERQRVMLGAATTGKGGFETIASEDGTQLDLNYRDSSITVKGSATQSNVQAGDRAPDAQLTDAVGYQTN